MNIVRNGKNFNVVEINGIILLENTSFEQAREFLAENGNKDAKKDLWNHSRVRRGENINIDAYPSGPVYFDDRSF